MFEPSGTSSGKVLFNATDFDFIPISYAEPLLGTAGRCNGSAKRFFDIIASLLILTAFALPMLVIAILIRIESPGPVVFRQRRTGYRNLPFETLKFRTMYRHAPDRGHLRQTTRHDPRVTPIGAVLRRLSLDELPQLFNVLRGDMSLVGPRPHAPGTCAGGKPFELVTPRYPARHRVRPGITGLAQVRGLRGETETEDKLLRRVAADLEYIETWTPWLDLVVLARTVISVFSTRNAY